MNDLTTVPESDAFARGLAQFDALKKRADYYEDLAAQWQRHAEKLTSECEMHQRRIKELDHKLGYYMRHSTELKVGLETSVKIIDDVLQKARQGAYRPNGAAPEADRPDPLQVPKFLTEGPRVDDGPKAGPDIIAELEKTLMTERPSGGQT